MGWLPTSNVQEGWALLRMGCTLTLFCDFCGCETNLLVPFGESFVCQKCKEVCKSPKNSSPFFETASTPQTSPLQFFKVKFQGEVKSLNQLELEDFFCEQ